jgi:hypothetical protein
MDSTLPPTNIPAPGPGTVLHVVDGASLQSAPSAVVTADWTIGAGNGREEQLGFVVGMDVDAAGRLYLLDPLCACARVYGPAGQFLRQFGKRRSGPGELKAPHGEVEPRALSGLAVSGDTVFVLDDHLQMFDTAGTFLSRSSPSLLFNTAASITATPSGLLVNRRPMRTPDADVYEFSLYDARRETEEEVFSVVEHTITMGYVHRRPLPTGPLVFTVAESGSVYFAASDSFDIIRVGLDGRAHERFIAHIERVPVQSSDIQDLAASLNRFVQDRIHLE